MGFDVTTPVSRVSNKAGLKPVSSATETSLEIRIVLAFSKFRYGTIKKVNTKGADQSVQLRRLVGAILVCKHRRQVLFRQYPYINVIYI